MTSNSCDELKLLLDKGFYGDNFADLVAAAYEAAQEADDPLPFYVLAKIFGPLAYKYSNDDAPLTVETSERMEQHSIPEMRALLDGISSSITPEAQLMTLNKLVKLDLSWHEP